MNYDKWVKSGFATTTIFNGITNCLMTDVVISCPGNLCTDGRDKQIAVKAIWDTGATNTSIDQNLAKQLNLIPIGKCRLAHAQGESIVNTYTFNLSLSPEFSIRVTSATEGDFLNSTQKVLVGMDVIPIGDFFFGQKENAANKQSFFTFSIPSIGRDIDFVKELDSARKKESFTYTSVLTRRHLYI